MIQSLCLRTVSYAIATFAILSTTGAMANALREKGKPTTVASSSLAVTPTRDWNKLSASLGKGVETWTLDGDELNDVTFFAGIEPGKPLVREVSKRRKPLPKFTKDTLLVEVPELVEGTYRASKDIATFVVTSAKPDRFLGREGIRFTFEYVDNDALPRRGEGRATLANGLLYMSLFCAPRINYYERTLADYRALADSGRLN